MYSSEEEIDHIRVEKPKEQHLLTPDPQMLLWSQQTAESSFQVFICVTVYFPDKIKVKQCSYIPFPSPTHAIYYRTVYGTKCSIYI